MTSQQDVGLQDSSVTVRAMDHIVVNVADIEVSLQWYEDVLGFERMRYDEWKAGKVPFVSIRVSEHTIIDLFELDRTGENINHFALWVDGDVDALVARDDIEIVREFKQLYGAQGVGRSVSIRDPDGNQVELKQYATD